MSLPSGTLTTASATSLTYLDAGVDIAAGEAMVDRIMPLAARTFRKEVIGNIGQFAGLFQLAGHYVEPVLVSSTDGVGTKLKLAQMLGRHDTIGIDLVAMSVNDILVQGAEPLFFLDYFSTGKLDADLATTVIAGIVKGCELAGCSLIAGETAEMPGMYASGEYDLAGFCVGVVEKSSLMDGSKVRAGDAILGIAASGPHANGYSLIRKILQVSQADIHQSLDETTLADALMAPTTIYSQSVLELIRCIDIHAMAHITGGGLKKNIIRTVPQNLGVDIDASTLSLPLVFQWLQHNGSISHSQMWSTFNCGIGFALFLDPADIATARTLLAAHGLKSSVIGQVKNACSNERVHIG